MRVVVTGYAVGFRRKEKKSKQDEYYYVLDLLQFGNENNNSEIEYLIIYDLDIAKFLNENFSDGKIKIISCKVDLIKNKTDYIWVVKSIETFGSVTNLSNVTISKELLNKVKHYLLSSDNEKTVNDYIEDIITNSLEEIEDEEEDSNSSNTNDS